MSEGLRLLVSLISGIVTGIVLSIPPLGPTSIAILSKGFKNEVKQGTAISSGAGFMDFVYVLVAFGGMSLIKLFIPESVNDFFARNENLFITILTFAGSAIVVIYGIKLIRSKQGDKKFSVNENENILEVTDEEQILEKHNILQNEILTRVKIKDNNNYIVKNFFTGVVFCLSSVTLPASWILVIGYLKSYGILDSYFITGFFFAIGVWFGTTLWFYSILVFISKNLKRIKPSALNKLNVNVGIFLIGLGIFLLYKALDFAIQH